MNDRSDPAAEAQRIAESLRAGGASELAVAADPIWVVGCAASGHRIQILWDTHASSYQVSRWVDAPVVTQPLGSFRAWKGAVVCALQA